MHTVTTFLFQYDLTEMVWNILQVLKIQPVSLYMVIGCPDLCFNGHPLFSSVTAEQWDVSRCQMKYWLKLYKAAEGGVEGKADRGKEECLVCWQFLGNYGQFATAVFYTCLFSLLIQDNEINSERLIRSSIMKKASLHALIV
jgi:hypothetical protein